MTESKLDASNFVEQASAGGEEQDAGGEPGEHFDAVAAVAELEAAMEAADAAGEPGGSDRYIAMLEDEVMQLTALVETRDAELTEARHRVDQAHEEVQHASERLRRDSAAQLGRSTKKVLLAFVEVLDDLDRALSSAVATDHNPEVVAGVDLVRRRFWATLQGFGVSRLDTLEARFDPNLHQAISVIPAAEARDGLVVSVVLEGYLINGELLRAASVVVGKADTAG